MSRKDWAAAQFVQVGAAVGSIMWTTDTEEVLRSNMEYAARQRSRFCCSST